MAATASDLPPIGLSGLVENGAVNHHSDNPQTTACDEAVPTHPLKVRPLGNKYLATGPDARASIGAFRRWPDEFLLTFLERLDAQSLRKLGWSCKFFFAFSHLDELWKSLFLQSEDRGHQCVAWKASWRSTVLRLPPDSRAHVDCENVFSDVIHRPFVCSHVALSRFADTIPKTNEIARMKNVSYSEFALNWAETPFILTQCIKDWPALKEWSLDYFCQTYGSTPFRAEAVDWTFSTYSEYMKNSTDESPLYLFDKKFAEKMGIAVGNNSNSSSSPQEAQYWLPECFGPDLFEVLGDERPAHRWLIIGPRRSGSTFHKDPNATSAWNAVVRGRKYWIMFPPRARVPGVYVSGDGSEVTSPLSIAEWLLEFHAEARGLAGCREGVCREGEMVHVPSGWWHLVVNLEDGIALTQNFVPVSENLRHLADVVGFLRDKPDQVTGFRRDVKDPYRLFAQRLGENEQYSGLLEKAIAVLEQRASTRKRKWDAVVEGGEDQGEGGFSFGFADEEIP